MRKRRRRGLRRAGLWLPIVAGLLVFVAVAAALLVRDVGRVRASLQAAQASLAEVRTAAGQVELDAARAALEDADGDLAVARSRSGGPLWSLAARVPVVGGSVRATRDVVAVVSAAVDVADRALADGGRLVGRGLDVSVEDGQLDLAPLTEAAAVLEQLPIDRLVATRDRLAAGAPRWAPAEIVDARARTLAYADELIATVRGGQDLLAALPGFLGQDGERRYFLGVQSPSELRGTGGLIGYYAVLTVEDGRFELGRSEVYEGTDDLTEASATAAIGQLSGDPTDGVEADPAFEERYGASASTALFSNVNLDPDLPTVAEVALDLFEQRTGERLDGLVLIDPLAMEALLGAIGAPLDVPRDLAPGADLPATIAPAQLAEFILVDVYDQLGLGHGDERKRLLRGLGDVAFARVFDGSWDGVAVSQALSRAAGERHLQVYSRDEAEQAAFDRLGVTGRFAAPVEGADVLAVTANNAVGGKQDVHVRHAVRADVTLGDPRRADEGPVTVQRDTSLRVELDNPLPSEGMDPYIIGNCLVAAGTPGRCFEGPPGENRTWFSTWVPAGTTLEAARGDDGRTATRTGQLHGFNVFDRFLETPSRTTQGYENDLSGRAPARLEDGVLVYELAWWDQAKAIPTSLDVRVTPPDGWRVSDVSVEGGGAPGMTVAGETVPVSVEVEDGAARLRGDVTADTVLEVRMVGARS